MSDDKSVLLNRARSTPTFQTTIKTCSINGFLRGIPLRREKIIGLDCFTLPRCSENKEKLLFFPTDLLISKVCSLVILFQG